MYSLPQKKHLLVCAMSITSEKCKTINMAFFEDDVRRGAKGGCHYPDY
jgi:hypothetical protein